MSTAANAIANGLSGVSRAARRHLPLAGLAGLYLAVFAGWLWLLAAGIGWLSVAVATRLI